MKTLSAVIEQIKKCAVKKGKRKPDVRRIPVSVCEMSYAMSRVVRDSTAKTVPTTKAIRRTVVVGHLLVAGKTRENARKATGITQAAAKVTRPHISVRTPLSTPPMPRTHAAIDRVSMAKRRFI